jgi:hypothetical protein
MNDIANYYYCPDCEKCWDFQGAEVHPEWLPEFIENYKKQRISKREVIK